MAIQRSQARRENSRRNDGALTGYLLVVGAASLWGLIGPVARFALAEGVSPLEIAFWRAVMGGLLYAIHARNRGARGISGADLPLIVAFGIIGVAFFYGAYLLAVVAGGAALASVLLYTAPAWVAIGAWLWLRERLDRRTVAALALAIGGVAIIALAGGGEVRFGAAAILWGLGAGLAYATYYLVGKRFFGIYGTYTVLAYALPVGAMALLPFVRFADKSALAWVVIVFLAVVPTYVAYLIYGAGLQRITATRAATIATLEPLIAGVAAFLIWGETLGVWGYAGAALVLTAVALIASAPRGVAAPERVTRPG